eukprot:gene1105-3188_t
MVQYKWWYPSTHNYECYNKWWYPSTHNNERYNNGSLLQGMVPHKWWYPSTQVHKHDNILDSGHYKGSYQQGMVPHKWWYPSTQNYEWTRPSPPDHKQGKCCILYEWCYPPTQNYKQAMDQHKWWFPSTHNYECYNKGLQQGMVPHKYKWWYPSTLNNKSHNNGSLQQQSDCDDHNKGGGAPGPPLALDDQRWYPSTHGDKIQYDPYNGGYEMKSGHYQRADPNGPTQSNKKDHTHRQRPIMPEGAGGPPGTPRPAQTSDAQIRGSYLRQCTTIRELQAKVERLSGELQTEWDKIPAVVRIVRKLYNQEKQDTTQ